MPRADEALRRLAGDVLAGIDDLAGFQRDQADQRLHGRRFAGAIGADDDHHLAGIDGEIDALEDIHPAIAAEEAGCLQQRASPRS